MRNMIVKAMALAVLTAGAVLGQVTTNCTPTTLPEVVQTIVSVTCQPSGGLPPYTWSISSGQLPAGLSQDPGSGAITGTLQGPAGPFSFTVLATDSTPILPLTGSQSYSGTIVNPLAASCTLTTGPLEVGIQYTDPCTASGGTGPYTWSVSAQSGTLPPGLTISTTGVVTDLPTTSLASYQYRVLATDNSSPTKLTKGVEFTGSIAPAVTIATPGTLPGAMVGSAYSQQFAVSAGTGVSPFVWGATGLPAWLTMSAGGLLSSTTNPASTGTVTFMVNVTDAAGGASSGSFSLTTSQGLTITTTSPLPAATVGVSYTEPFGASGGTPPYTWSVSAQPGWLSMSAAGVLSGTPPSTAITSTFTVKVTDSNNNTASPMFTLPVTLAITTASPLPAATLSASYSQTLAAVGGTGSYTWSVTAGSLPTGLSLSSGGILSGTVAANATNGAFTLTVTDSSNASASLPFTLPVTLAITTLSPLPAANIGSAYSQTLAAGGGAGGYTWTATGLPSWLTLSAAGVLTSTAVPATALDASFKVTVTDSAKSTASGNFTVPVTLAITTNPALSPAVVNTNYTATFAAQGGAGGYSWTATGLPSWATLTTAGVLSGTPTATGTVMFPVTVTDSLGATQAVTFTLPVNLPALTITTTGLANGAVGAQYNQTLTGTGGLSPYTWALATGSGPLPAGLTLSSSGPTTATISGMPGKAGTFTFTVQLTDSTTPTPNTTTKAFTIVISAGLTITTPAALPNATVGAAYMQTLAAAGGVPPYNWSPVGTLPAPLAALSLSSGGVISGTPTATAAATSFSVTVTDSTGASANQQFTIAIVIAPTITTTTLPNGTPGVAYSQILTASGGTTPYKWSVLTGTLPGGLTLSTTGTISGVPGAAGASTFTVQLTDATGVTASKALTLTIIAALSISTTSPLPTGEIGVPYSQTLAAAGGTPPYTWTLTAGALPQGLTLSTSGLLAGTPGAAGTFSLKVQVTDSNQLTATSTLALTIVGAVTISTPATLNGGSLNATYTQSLAATGGVTPYTWTLTAGTLPSGLTLAPGGVISGTPKATGTFLFTLTVTDSLGGKASRQFTIVVGVGLTVTTPATLPAGTVKVAYSISLEASGGTPPYTWLTSSGTPPAGLAVSSNGLFSGVPTAAGTFSFTVQVTDSLGHQATAQLSITIAPPLVITTASLPGGAVGASYAQSLAATGGTPPYTWSLVTGSLPAGVSLSAAGAITGAPGAAGTFTFSVLVTDSAGVTQTKQFSIVVTSGVAITTAATLPNASLNVSYTETLGAAGGTPPYTWTTPGGLPGGLSLSPAGVISGTPNATGVFQFSVVATDSAHLSASQQFTLAVVNGLSITTNSLPAGKVGAAYSQAVTAAGGTPPYTFTTSAGSLPTGLALNGATISGTPTTIGSYTFTIQVADSASAKATQQFTIVIGGLAITTTALPSAAVGAAYSATLSAAGTAPYTWVVTQGTLPSGLTLDTSSGTISGTPTAAGTSNITVQVTDNTGAATSAAFTLTVISASFTGLPATAASAQQLSFTLTPGAAYPQDIAGQVTLAFQPDPSLASPAVDPAIQFSTGGSAASFTIPANSTAPPSFALQTGTVAGTITLTVTWQAGGANLAVPAALAQTIQVAPAVPVISAVTATTTSSGFQVVATGFSNTREVSQAVLVFTPASGQTLQTTGLTVPLTSFADTWFQGSTSDQYGSQFILTLPFTVTDGSASAIGSMSVQLVNSQGTSTAASASF